MTALDSILGKQSYARRAARWAKRRVVPSGAILMYHRIADERLDPWRLCVSPENFAEHLQLLRAARVRLMTVADLAASLATGVVPRRAVAITFDDGYRDNLDAGLPLLEQFEAPATLFVASGYVGFKGEFWWDALERVFLAAGELPETLELTVNGEERCWKLGQDAAKVGENAEDSCGWNPSSTPQTIRQRLYTELRNLLLFASADERARIPAELLRWAGLSETARPTRRILDVDGLRRVARDGLVEIGGHSVSHPDLSGLSEAAQEQELRAGKTALETMLEHPLRGMAYPHGGCTPETRRLAQEAGFAYACGTKAAPLRSNSDAHQLPRIGITNVSGAEFRSKLAGFIPL